MKRLTLLVTSLFLVVGLVGPMASQAQTSFKIGPRVGIPLGDVSDAGGNLFVGADARITSEGLPVVINPSLDFYLMDDYGSANTQVSQSIIAVDVNGLYEFGIDNQAFTPYAGGGLAITRWSVDWPSGTGSQFDPSTTEVGLNLVGGARFPLGSLEPFAQLNATIGGDIQRLGVTGGVLFGF
jgi:hypothetical protein